MHAVIGFMMMSAITISVLLVMGLGLMQSSWDLATSWFIYQDQEIQRFEGRIKRVDDLPVTAVNLVQLNWKNDGAAPLAEFSDWDVILEIDEGAGIQILPLAYTASTTPGTNEWAIQGIYQDAGALTPEIADPGILNPDEEMVVLLNPSPAVTTNNFHRVTMVTSGGYAANVMFYSVDPNLFFHTETTLISTTTYMQLKNGDSADGTATTTSAVFAPGQTGRVRPSLQDGKFVYSLASTSAFIASTWDVTYRVKSNGGGFTWLVNAEDISLSTTNSWQDIDLSPYVPAGATGAIVEVVNTGNSSSYSGVVRGKEDARDYMSNTSYEEIESETHRWL
ncbi:MAG TPA: hypothetical protein DCP37_09105 [Dehalococcoidia bacterium]|jgi:hypothetical protein|nr:hypothetical protein [SAR202 cluster bacterium]MDP6663972.1 hypothetical protein [SAR202 cluster bacterium]MQG56861.1 hypothetical protein [SAR202 cluster bacterium]HAL47898.1 hypothetical protein [Dehalococcoidia bacterium]|tara:strand:- start:22 stop:1029 length:1008 start_codon:yes stop_codon:yes gene_type:complete